MRINRILFQAKQQELSLSKHSLAQDICPPDLLQQIEAGYSTDLRTLHKLGRRLETPWLQLIASEEFADTLSLLTIVDYLYHRDCYAEGFRLLQERIQTRHLSDSFILARIWYYYGLGHLHEQNTKEAVLHFQRSLTMSEGEGPYALLSLSGMGSAYWQNNEYQRSETFFKKALSLMNLCEETSPEFAVIYIDAANFYNQQQKPQKAGVLCQKGRALLAEHKTSELLEKLLLSQGISWLLMDQPSKKVCKILEEALAQAAINENHALFQRIEEHIFLAQEQIS